VRERGGGRARERERETWRTRRGRRLRARTRQFATAHIHNTYRTCPVQTFGRAGTNLGRATGPDLLMQVGVVSPGALDEMRDWTHGGLRTFHQKSTCLHKINFRASSGLNFVTPPPRLPTWRTRRGRPRRVRWRRCATARSCIQGLGFRVKGLGFSFQLSGFRVQGSGFRVQGL